MTLCKTKNLTQSFPKVYICDAISSQCVSPVHMAGPPALVANMYATALEPLCFPCLSPAPSLFPFTWVQTSALMLISTNKCGWCSLRKEKPTLSSS